MMAPDAPEPQPPRLAAPQAGHGSAQASGAGPVSSRATLRWPHAKRPEPLRSPEPTSPSSESSANGDSDDESEDDRGHGFRGRGHGEKNHSGEGSASDEVSPAGQPSPELGGSEDREQPEAVAEPVQKAALAARAAAVFDTTAGSPTEVRKPLMASMVTNAVVQDAIQVCDDLCDRDGPALSQAFGHFDRRVALGWLLADVAGMPLLQRTQAHALGIKAQRANSAAKAAIRDARKKAIAPARAAGADISVAQDEAEAAVLRSDAEVLAPQQLTATAPAGSGPTGSRKRARESEPSHEHEVRRAEESLLKAEKQVSKAEKKLERAEAAEDEVLARSQRVAARMDDSKSMTGKQMRGLLCKMDAANEKDSEAQLASKDAEIALLRAQLAERDAEIDVLMLQWDHSIQQLDRTVEIARESAKIENKCNIFRDCARSCGRCGRVLWFQCVSMFLL